MLMVCLEVSGTGGRPPLPNLGVNQMAKETRTNPSTGVHEERDTFMGIPTSAWLPSLKR